MGLSLLAWSNAVPDAALTNVGAGSFAGLDVDQLRNDQGSPSRGWQINGTSAALTIDAGTTSAVWRAFALARTNLTSSATIRWRVGSFDSGTIPAGVVARYMQSVCVAGSDVTTQVARVDISDPSNPDGFLSIPLIYAGPAWVPDIGIAYSSTFGRDTQVDELTTRAGQEYPTLRWSRRRWSIELSAVRQAEIYASLDKLDAASRSGSNVLFVPNVTASDINQSSIYGRCEVTQDVTYPYLGGDARSWKADIKERL